MIEALRHACLINLRARSGDASNILIDPESTLLEPSKPPSLTMKLLQNWHPTFYSATAPFDFHLQMHRVAAAVIPSRAVVSTVSRQRWPSWVYGVVGRTLWHWKHSEPRRLVGDHCRKEQIVVSLQAHHCPPLRAALAVHLLDSVLVLLCLPLLCDLAFHLWLLGGLAWATPTSALHPSKPHCCKPHYFQLIQAATKWIGQA